MGGFSGTVKNLVLITESVLRRCSHRLPPESERVRYVNYAWKVLNLLFNLFLLGWVVAGSYWIYHVYPTVNRAGYNASSTCDELLYKFSFGILTSSYILLAIMLFFVCCCGLCLRESRSGHAPVEVEAEDEVGEESEGGSVSGDGGGGSCESGGGSEEGELEGEGNGSNSGEEPWWERHRLEANGRGVFGGTGDDEGDGGSIELEISTATQETTVDLRGESLVAQSVCNSGLPDTGTGMALEMVEYTASPARARLSPRRFHPTDNPLSLASSHQPPSSDPSPSLAAPSPSDLYVTGGSFGHSCTPV